MFDDLRALVEFARAGSVAGAAERLYRTPSAITRQLQRLEAALGAELLDRSVKPPRLNSLGTRVLEHARDLLQRTEALKSVTSSDAEPDGLLRIGLSHPLAEGTLIGPILALSEKYPRVRLRLLSELTTELFRRLLAGELEAAVVLLPEGKTAPPPLLTNIIASDRMEIVQGAAAACPLHCPESLDPHRESASSAVVRTESVHRDCAGRTTRRAGESRRTAGTRHPPIVRASQHEKAAQEGAREAGVGAAMPGAGGLSGTSGARRVRH
jgi:DNA-binding transcriptional LysR family regulator